MKNGNNNFFSKPVKVFHGQRLPAEAIPAGYSALIHAYNLNVPKPYILYATGKFHKEFEENGWHILTPRYAPLPTLEGHLVFALKYEGLNLAILKRLFETVSSSRIKAIVKKKPTGSYARRIWFLYEWLTGKKLDLDNVNKGNYVPVVDPDLQYCIDGKNSPRHRVRNNLPGTPNFWLRIYKLAKDSIKREKKFHKKYCKGKCICSVFDDIARVSVNFTILYLETQNIIPVSKNQIWQNIQKLSSKLNREVLEGIKLALKFSGKDKYLTLSQADKILISANWLKKNLEKNT